MVPQQTKILVQEPNLLNQEVEVFLRKGVIKKVYLKLTQLVSNLFLVRVV